MESNILYDEVMHRFFQGKNYGCAGHNYEDINWYEKNEPKPAKERLEILWEEIKKQVASEQRKKDIRGAIQENAGDTDSILGTTSNTAHLLMSVVMKLISAISKAESFEEVKKGAAPFAEIADKFLTKVETGEIKLPYALRDLNKVMDEIGKRATGVTEAIKSPPASIEKEGKEAAPMTVAAQ